MRTPDPRHRNLPLLLLHAREAALAHFRPILKQFQLTDQQWRVLRVLAAAAHPGLEAGQIADACKILSPSLTGIVSRLEQMHLVSREWSEVDQRRQIIRLTEEGVRLVARVTPYIDEQYRRIEELLGEQTLAEIYQAIDRVVALLHQPIPSVLREPSEMEKTQRAVGGAAARVRSPARRSIRPGRSSVGNARKSAGDS
jgi:homoprotocatechuate degradation regulator HpaR